MPRHAPKKLMPTVFRLETRDVPTVISPLAFGRGAAIQKELAAEMSAAAASSVVPAATATSPPVGIIAPGYIDPARLTARGLADGKFVARASGPFAVSGATYVGYKSQVTYIGPIASNQFLQGTLNTKIQVPPTPIPMNPANPSSITPSGFIALRDRNVASTGTILVLDVQVTGLDRFGRPTSMYWIVDDNGSGGTYAGAAGQGTISITYRQSGHSKFSAGGATLLFQGIVVPNGVNNITDNTLDHFA
jgi:hypothetical protein